MKDMLDLSQVTILNSPDVRGWPITSEITRIAFGGGKIHTDHTKRGHWPPVQFETATQEATVWVFFKIGGVWYGTGGERLRPNQTEKDLTFPSHIGPGWLYAQDRWRQMTNYVPTPGELVGFMIAAGISRGFGEAPVQERTAVVLIPFPRDDVGGSYPPWAQAAAPIDPGGGIDVPVDPEPQPSPPPSSDDTMIAVLLRTILEQQQQTQQLLNAQAEDFADFRKEVEQAVMMIQPPSYTGTQVAVGRKLILTPKTMKF